MTHLRNYSHIFIKKGNEMSVGTTKQTEIVKQQEPQFTVKYTPFGEKNEITLSVDMVAKFISARTASGKIASHNDIVTFMMLCKSSGLNPWIKDAYLIGYDSKDGPTFTLIVAHQSLLKRAELSSEYDGMDSGIVVIAKGSSETIQRPGTLVLPGETLVGGWAAVYRRDRSRPSAATVSLATYSTGRSRWSIDPAGMIAKVAEGAALRKAFPSTLAQCYLREEFERDLDRDDRPAKTIVSVKHESKSAEIAAKYLQRNTIAIESQPEQDEQDNSDDRQPTGDDIESDYPQRPRSNLRELETMMASAGISSVDHDPSTGTQSYELPDGMKLRFGNGLEETKSKKDFIILDAMKDESPVKLKEILEIATKVKK